jgi:very-short-patch-repair endonuclease
MTASLSAASEETLPAIAESLLQHFPPSADLRNQIQEAIWSRQSTAEIPERFRRELCREVGGADELFLRAEPFERLLDQLWVLDTDSVAVFFSDRISGLRREIHQHVFKNPEDWSAEYLFEKLGAFESSDQRFARFIEGLASAQIRPDIDAQVKFVGVVNEVLRSCGVELREVATQGGYPVFHLVWLSKGVQGRPKNIIFASPTKPDIRFRDAINNDIEIAANVDAVLVFDRPVPPGGLLWSDLQDWWAERMNQSAEDAKKSLYKRLLESLPQNSPPQRFVFTTYGKYFGSAVPKLPALLPEVWLHWDPKTVRERGTNALLRFRMDFLMLLPNNVRVVIEVDGKHHYADPDGQASPMRYGAMLSADRDLRLAGYDVYRFGADELTGPSSESVVAEFFEQMFRLHHVEIPANKQTAKFR